jgi:integral membrane protein
MPTWFKLIGRLEGVSFLVLLLLAMPLKYYAGWPMGVKIMGSVHGGLFLAYCAAVFMVGASAEWSAKKQLLAFLAAVFPCGTFMFEKKYA